MSTIDLSGKTAIVTGGGRGLGRAMALALAEAGANVCAATYLPEDIDKLQADGEGLAGRVMAIETDIRDVEDCARAVHGTIDTFGGLDILVNNAGVGMALISDSFTRDPVKFWDIEPATWRRIIDTNFTGAFQMAREATPHLLEKGWGRIVNITTSIHTMQRRGYSPYGSSKAAFEAASLSWAEDLDGTGVSVNILIPGGAADTHLLPGNPGDPGRAGADGMLLDPMVMKTGIQWLASDFSDGINGKRFIGNDWDMSLPPEQGGKNAAGPIGFAPRPKD
jgi:NAD(P)-dependent dehydrogenase (short-subunit alcohol dehydrogenase family)